MQYYRIHASIVRGGEKCCPVFWVWYGMPFPTENTHETWNGIYTLLTALEHSACDIRGQKYEGTGERYDAEHGSAAVT